MLISSSIRRKIETLFDNVHDTFGRTITAYKDAEKVVTITTPQYNPIYGNAGGSSLSVQKTTQSQQISARIHYISNSEEYFRDSEIDSELKLSLPKSVVRLKVDSSGKDFLQDAKRVDLDGIRYRIINDSFPEQISLYNSKFFAFYLAQIDEE